MTQLAFSNPAECDSAVLDQEVFVRDATKE